MCFECSCRIRRKTQKKNWVSNCPTRGKQAIGLFCAETSDLGGHIIKPASKAHLVHYVLSLQCECVCVCVGGLIVPPQQATSFVVWEIAAWLTMINTLRILIFWVWGTTSTAVNQCSIFINQSVCCCLVSIQHGQQYDIQMNQCGWTCVLSWPG